MCSVNWELGNLAVDGPAATFNYNKADYKHNMSRCLPYRAQDAVSSGVDRTTVIACTNICDLSARNMLTVTAFHDCTTVQPAVTLELSTHAVQTAYHVALRTSVLFPLSLPPLLASPRHSHVNEVLRILLNARILPHCCRQKASS